MIVGAYVAMDPQWDSALRARFLDEIADQTEVTGWETPLSAPQLEPVVERLAHIESESAFVTLMSAEVAAGAHDANFGLASPHPEGRAAAVELVRTSLVDSRRVNDRLGRIAVAGIEFHSAPRLRGTASALARSISELSDEHWGDIQPLLEHADAPRPGHEPVRGFLALDDELQVLEQAATQTRLVINWGRSVIEGRSVTTPVAHLRATRSAAMLHGLFFSGATDDVAFREGAWADSHVAPRLILPGAEPSLLGADEIAAARRAAGDDLKVLGLKVSCAPGSTFRQRVDVVTASAAMITDN